MTGWRNVSGGMSVRVFDRLFFGHALAQHSFCFVSFGLPRLGIAYRIRRRHPLQGLRVTRRMS